MGAAGAAGIEVSSLRVQYGRLVAVHDVDFAVRPGEVVALLGPNGAGKTSALEAVEGYRKPAAGQVRVLGMDPVRERRALTPRLGVMLQHGGVYPSMGPLEALRLFASYYSSPEQPQRLLGMLALAQVARVPWRRLSGGQQQRLCLALALIGRPEVALLDEPTSGVDPEGRTVMRAAIDELRQRGASVLMTTHELQEAERLADRVLIMAAGRLVAAGTLGQLAAQAGPRRIHWSSRPGLDAGVLARRLGGVVSEDEPGRYTVSLPDEGASAAAVVAIGSWLAELGSPLEDLRTGRPSLEEVYFELTGNENAAPGTGQGPP